MRASGAEWMAGWGDGAKCYLAGHWWNPAGHAFHYRCHGGWTPFPGKSANPGECPSYRHLRIVPKEKGSGPCSNWVQTFQLEGLYSGKNGALWAAREGQLTFARKKKRYNQNTPKTAWQQNPDGGGKLKAVGPSSQVRLVLGRLRNVSHRLVRRGMADFTVGDYK